MIKKYPQIRKLQDKLHVRISWIPWGGARRVGVRKVSKVPKAISYGSKYMRVLAVLLGKYCIRFSFAYLATTANY